MSGFINFLDKHSQGRTVLALFIATNLLYGLMLLVTIPALTKFSGGLMIPDMMPTGYDHTYLQRLMEALGEDGRRYYLTRQLPVDLLYPLLFGLTYSLLTAWSFKRLGAFGRRVAYLALLPLIAALADYAENFGLAAVLLQYPNNSEILSRVTSAFTWIKSASTTLFFTFFLLALGYLILKKVRSTKKAG